MRRELDVLFGFDWDFRIKSKDVIEGYIVVEGALTGRVNGKPITKEQFGGALIKYKTKMQGGQKVKTEQPLDIGNDFKAAATDALKKCAAEFGICRDIYYSNEFVEARLLTEEEVEAVKRAKREQLEAEQTRPLTDKERHAIVESVQAIKNTTEKMRLIKMVTGRIKMPEGKKLGEVSDHEYRELNEAIAELGGSKPVKEEYSKNDNNNPKNDT